MITHFHSWLRFVNQLIHTNAPKPNPNRFKVLLSLFPDIHAGMTLEEVFRRELDVRLYERPTAVWSGEGTVVPEISTHNFEGVRFVIRAETQDLVFRSVVLVSDVQSAVPWFEVAGVNSTTGNITTTEPHTFSTGDRVLFTSTGTMPAGMPTGFLTVERISSNVVRLKRAEVNIVPNSPGSGLRLLRCVQEPMRPYLFENFENNIIVPARSTRTYQLVSRVRGI